MHILSVPDTIRYSITPCSGGVNLSVWETASAAGVREQSFLFKINQRVSSNEEAQQLLKRYLASFN